MPMNLVFDSSQELGSQLKIVLARFPNIKLAILFGSVALGRETVESDLDIAVSTNAMLTAVEKHAIISELTQLTGRSIDLIDLKLASEPLLGQILRYGKRLLGSDTLYGNFIYSHLVAQADFMPYRSRLLQERRMAWIGK